VLYDANAVVEMSVNVSESASQAAITIANMKKTHTLLLMY